MACEYEAKWLSSPAVLPSIVQGGLSLELPCGRHMERWLWSDLQDLNTRRLHCANSTKKVARW